MRKKVLILCTGNSCRSIIAEALINAKLSEKVEAFSAGVKASGKVNENAKKVLQENGYWDEAYHSKTVEELGDISYDLVVTVCDNAKESCPVFSNASRVIHVGFEDPDGKEIDAFYETLELIESELLPALNLYL